MYTDRAGRKVSGTMRAKMRVGSVRKQYRQANYGKPENGIIESMELVMYPVGGPGNEEWNKSTPSGELKLVVNNEGAFPFIEQMPGKEFYLDITPVEESAPL